MTFLIVETPRGSEVHVNGLPCGIVTEKGYEPQKYVNNQTGEPYALSIDDRARQAQSTKAAVLDKVSAVLSAMR